MSNREGSVTPPVIAQESEAFDRGAVATYLILGVLLIFYMLSSLDRGLLSLLVTPVKVDLGVSDLKMSLLLGVAFALFYAVCGVPIGWLVDRFPRRWILYFGVTCWSLATVACGMAQSYPQLLMARMALGMSEASLGPAAHSIIADSFSKKRVATALSIYTGGAVLGTGGSILLGGYILRHLSDYESIDLPVFGVVAPWQAAFIILGLPGLIAALAAFSFREPPRRIRKVAVPLMPFVRSRWKVLTCFSCAFAIYSMALYGAFLWIPAHMDRHFGWDAGQAGPILGLINMIATGIGTLGGGFITDYLAGRGYRDAALRVFFVAIASGAPIGAIGFLVDSPVVFLVCIGWLQLLTFSYIGYAAAAVQAVTPQALRGRLAGCYLLVLALIGNGGGPSLIAFFSQHVFTGPNSLGLAIALTIGIVTPIALVATALGMKPMREAVIAIENEAEPDDAPEDERVAHS